jgi:tRNA A-37 threonylcarbamoyl transferase component Bud32
MPDDWLPARRPKAPGGDPTPTPEHLAEDTSSYLAEDSSDSAPSSLLNDLPAELLNHPHFQVLRELGRGGMGVVYLAEHRVMKRLVALKLIRPGLLEKPYALQRYQREIKLAAGLDHRNVVRALHAEQLGKVHMLVMEYVEGKDLARVLRRHGKLPVAHSCSYARQAALGLQHAHEVARLVHRDVKPSNLMLTAKGLVKVLDFGLARQPRLADRQVTITDARGHFVGTALYVSPEQALDAKSADPRSDVYSLGCTLYHFLAGRPPFQGEQGQTLISHQDQLALPLHEARPDVPEELSALVARMMAKDPASRIQSAGEVARLLLPFCRAEAAASSPASGGGPGGQATEAPPRRATNPSRIVAGVAAAGVVLSLCVVLLAMALSGPSADPAPGKGDPAEERKALVEPPQVPRAALVLHLDPADTVVEFVEGEAAGPPRDGKLELTLPPGEYAFEFTAPGYLPCVESFDLRDGKSQEWEITLAPEPPPSPVKPPATPVELEVRGVLAGAEVSVDPKPERESGEGPGLRKYTFPPSAKGKDVSITVTLKGYKAFARKVQLGTERTVDVELVKLPAAPRPARGVLRLRVNPAGSKLWIDGEPRTGETLGPDRWVELSLAAGGKHKLRLEKEGFEPREEEVEVAADRTTDLRRVLLRDEGKGKPLDYYAARGAKGTREEMRDASRNLIEPAEDMTAEGRELIGPRCWYTRPSVTRPFIRQGPGVLESIPAGFSAVEDCGASRDGRWLYLRLVPPGGQVRDEDKRPWLAARGKPGLPFTPRRGLHPFGEQWNLTKRVSLLPAALSLPAKRLSPNELVVFPPRSGVRGVRGNRMQHQSFKLEPTNANLPADYYPVAVGNNGSVVFSYFEGGRLWLAASDCLPNEPGKVGPFDGYTRPIPLVELSSGGSRSPLNRPTLSPDRRYLLLPDAPPPPEPGKSAQAGKTMLLRLQKETRQKILEVLDENP